ncbi:hypothetical protein DVA67_021830 [Solirubrobacter sp. CPCC 204708]|uniref:SagB/ThcOx family dehydrogenase n=1 Tax=Solirubrobacter deserti TaxID=2282478 RepID=A0ABT4RF03_9ACTN|nr:hypothetical protein [Solirubrobacter deserti]MBE2318634.1 hypothetical protein [Solirubrobacter deserti]MDA0137092.1 hypothetical protein [Solirubrobacter deserti]
MTGDAARLYHALSAYKAGDDFPATPADHPLVLQDLVTNDFARWPYPYKRYDLPRVPLPRELEGLGRVLYLSSGVVRTTQRPGRPNVLFRAAGSAGGRFPLELYVSALDGVHWYDPEQHALVRIAPPAGGEATTLIVTGVPWRTAWRYAERGFRHLYWDAGTMLSHVLALAPGARLFTRFPDEPVTRLVGADGVHEFPLAVVALDDGEPAIEPGGEAATGAVDAAPLELPLITAAQRAGDTDALGEPWPLRAEPVADDVILKRGSTRLMDETATIPRTVFETLLGALDGVRHPHFVAVHGVDDVAPGLYRWPEPLRTGNLRDELYRLCWDQPLGRTAAFVVMGAMDLAALDDRGYREAQLEAGIVEGRLHLAAYAHGLGASGMTFLDGEFEATIGAPLAATLFTCVGVPAYRNTAGGRPGAPVAVVVPSPE